eukprot:2614974-Rhodomonas_salina.1
MPLYRAALYLPTPLLCRVRISGTELLYGTTFCPAYYLPVLRSRLALRQVGYHATACPVLNYRMLLQAGLPPALISIVTSCRASVPALGEFLATD